jgi:glycosyltransferase involved in cell wall biosynthesis
MKILKVIHGYPPRYNADSEVYSQLFCQGLVNNHQVHVFTREENPFLPDFVVRDEKDTIDNRIKLHIINIVGERYRYRYRHVECDRVFASLLDQILPDIVHIGHLNHLSTSLINEIHIRKIPLVMTLHDYWLMCPRGQFMQRLGKTAEELWPVCDGQAHQKCAKHCYQGATSGAEASYEKEITYWEQWVAERMQHVQDIATYVDHFIAPSR